MVCELLEALQNDGLIEACDEGPAATDQDPVLQKADDQDGDRPEFTIPELHMHTDMQEFLLVDPIHEVDDSGWPHKKQPSPDQS